MDNRNNHLSFMSVVEVILPHEVVGSWVLKIHLASLNYGPFFCLFMAISERTAVE